MQLRPTSAGVCVITKEYVKAAYRLIHGREPESEAVLIEHVAHFASVQDLRHGFLSSPEFLSSRTIAGPIYAARVPERYAGNRLAYETRGGLARHNDADAFLLNGGAGNHPRHYFFALAVDQIVKEDVTGDFAELGVYRGASAAILAALARRAGRSLYLLDTFTGFAAADLVGIDAGRGREFSDTSIAAVRELVGGEAVLIDGRFPDTAARLPDDNPFALVHIDCNLYLPFKAALEYFWPRLAAGGFLVMHDYASLRWAGVEAAVDEFFADKAETIVPIPDVFGTAVARKHQR
jgi:O-methyltransferase